jgi:hypothetical protein
MRMLKVDEVLKKIRTPAKGLLAVGILNVAAGAFFSVFGILQLTGNWSREPAFAPDDQRLFYYIGMRVVVAVYALSLLLGLPMILGALQMMKGKKRGFSMVAAVLSLLPITACANPLGLIFGVWALVVLTREDVKTYFLQNSVADPG